MNKLLEPRTVVVGENTFYIRPLPAFRAANLTAELTALVIPLVSGLAPLLALVDPDKTGSGLLDINIEDATPAIAGAFSSLSGDKLEVILRHLLIAGKNIAVELSGERKAQPLTEDLANEIFCTDVQDMFVLAFEVIRTNYGGFFEKLRVRFGPLADKVQEMTTLRQNDMDTST